MTAPQQFGALVSAAPASAAAPNNGRQARTGPMPTGGRWGWYRDHEGNEFRRVSKLIKKVETDTYNLDLWHMRQVAIGMARRDDLVLGVKAMREPDEGWSREDKRKLDGIVKEAKAAAVSRNGARVGTAVHDLTERLDRGEPVDEVAKGLPAGPATSLRAYAFMRQANGWKSVEIERTVVNDEVEAAGTFDRVDEVPGLTALLGPWVCQHGHTHEGESQVIDDVKTEAQPWLNGLHIAPQLAIYSRAKRMWRPTGGTVMVQYGKTTEPVEVPAGEYVPAPCVRQDIGIVVHVHEGQSVPLFINLVEGWSAALAAYEQNNREARAKRELGSAGAWFAPVPGMVEPKPVQMFTEHAVAAKLGHLPAEPAPEHKVGGTVTVAGVEFTKHAEYPGLAETMPVMVGEHVAGDVGDTLMSNGVRTHEAVRGPDGLVRWQVADAGEPHIELGELATMLVKEIWQATTVERLGELWQLATDNGVPWRGAVERAGEARQRQIACPQRALHTGGGKCACGWMPPIPG